MRAFGIIVGYLTFAIILYAYHNIEDVACLFLRRMEGITEASGSLSGVSVSNFIT